MEQNQPQTPVSEKKTFFEKYQTFFALIICGIFIGGGLVASSAIKAVSLKSQNGQAVLTQDQVRDDLIDIAKKLKVNKNQFAACLDKGTMTEQVAADVALAEKSGVQGTPTFFIIKRTFGADDKIVTEKQIPVLGARDIATFEQAIQTMKSPAGQPALSGEKITLTDDDHWFGSRRAEIVIVEYSDIDCPFCKAAKPTIDELLKKHPEYAFVYRHSPIASLHPFATYKAEASECIKQISDQETFWKFLDEVVK